MGIISFGENIAGTSYKVLDERVMRASAGIMLFLGLIAFVNGFVLNRYVIIPYISGFLMFNFLIGVFINPKFSPTIIFTKLFVRKQSALPIGAIQKKVCMDFRFGLGMGNICIIFIFTK